MAWQCSQVCLVSSQRCLTFRHPCNYHSLIAEKGSGAAFREFIVFHNEYINVEYLIAYSRGKPGGVP